MILRLFSIFIFLCRCVYAHHYAHHSIIDFEKNNTTFYYFKDTHNQNIQEVLQKKQWKNSTTLLNLGYSSQPVWVKFSLKLQKDDLYLILNDYLLDAIDIYVVQDSKVIETYRSGIKQPIDTNLVEFRKTAIPLNFEINESYEVYIKASSAFYPINLPIQILSQENIFKIIGYDNSMLIMFFVIMLMMIVYNMFIYFTIKVSYYIEYILYLVLLVIMGLYSSGIVHDYLLPQGLNDLFIILFQTSGILMFYILLSLIVKFLDLPRLSKKIFNTLFIVLFVNFYLNMFLAMYLETRYFILNYIGQMIAVSLVILVSYYIIRRIFRFDMLSLIISLIWLPLSCGILFFIGNQVYLFVSPLISEYMMRVLFMYETIFISLLLAYNMKLLEKKKSEAEVLLQEKENQLIRANKLASMGEMLNNIAHQWKQPLARINSIVFKSYNLLEDNKTDNLKNELLLIEKETAHMSTTISSLLSYFHVNKTEEEFCIVSMIEKQKELILQAHANIDVHVKTFSNKVHIKGYKGEYEQVVRVIIENAIESMQESKTKMPRIDFNIQKEHEQTVLYIQNNGPQLKEALIGKIFEPYFTTKNKQTHEGIGLYMAKMLIEQSMKKTLNVENTSNGVQFIIKG